MTDTKGTILVRKDEWRLFLRTVTALVGAQTRLLKRSRNFKTKHGRVVEKKKRRKPQWRLCMDCGRRLLENARFCDSCGREAVT